MKKIDWSYHRPGWTSCRKAQEFLANASVEIKKEQHAKKETINATGAIELARQASDIYAAKGKKVVHLNMKKDEPDDETLTKLIVGPSGNLRAPTLRRGKTLIVGFHQETYERIFDWLKNRWPESNRYRPFGKQRKGAAFDPVVYWLSWQQPRNICSHLSFGLQPWSIA
jgi:arsenate reductase-like glutaredoxin family protein